MIPRNTINVPKFQPNFAEFVSQNLNEKFDLIIFQTCKNPSVLASTNVLNFTDIDLPTQTNAETL